mmetsp:Transcript_12373/g.30378  ORF Transcript_12373/g.30378 Transcript_12373/m.30378 type:complete len:591 (-) Transcript_12373:305-2077(-)
MEGLRTVEVIQGELQALGQQVETLPVGEPAWMVLQQRLVGLHNELAARQVERTELQRQKTLHLQKQHGLAPHQAAVIEERVLKKVLAASQGAGVLSTVSYEQYWQKRREGVAHVDIDQMARELGLALRTIPEDQATTLHIPQLPDKNVSEVNAMLPGVLAALKDIPGGRYSVEDTHARAYLDGSAPDITVTRVGRDVNSFNAVLLVELQRGELDNRHRGKSLRYCELLMRVNPTRGRALCALTNCESMEVYMAQRELGSEDGVIRHKRSGPVRMCSGHGWDFIRQLLSRDAHDLRLESPPLLLHGHHVTTLGLLGSGRGVAVYTVQYNGEDAACKVFDTSRAAAFRVELAVLTAVGQAHVPGLPLLVTSQSSDASTSSQAAKCMLLTQPVAARMEHLSHRNIQDIFTVLIHLHTKLKLVHRDVEPKHMAMDQGTGAFCLLDCGSAAPLSGSSVQLPDIAALRYAGTLLFASDDVLTALESSEFCPPHPRQDMVPLVKTACVLVHSRVAKAAGVVAVAVQEQLALGASNAIVGAVRLVRNFWDEQLGDTPAGSEWGKLVTAAHKIPEADADEYMGAAQELCNQLSRFLCPG